MSLSPVLTRPVALLHNQTCTHGVALALASNENVFSFPRADSNRANDVGDMGTSVVVERCTYVCIRIYRGMCVCVCVCIGEYVCVCTHTRARAHTHTHTQV
jgi:hypothetical protein